MGDLQTLFEHDNRLDKKQIWELDPESLLTLGSKVSNILEYWAGYKQHIQYQKLTQEHMQFGVLILILIPVFYNVNKN